jgi:steroid 5-alpha reductase family enzyme
MSRSTSPGKSLVQVALVVAVGALVAWAGASGGRTAAGIGVHWWVAAISFLVNWIVFVPSYLRGTEHFYDLTGSLTYLVTTVAAVALGGPADGRSWLLLAFVVVWAGRLGSFLFLRIRKAGKDERFDRIKGDPARFFMTWTLQGLWVIFTAAAAHAAIASTHRSSLGWWAAIGTIIWLIGFGIEAVSDEQKRRFKADPANDGRFISSGLWAWSRHPNYFGEIVLWIGVALVAVPGLRGWQYVTLLSPVFVTLLLTRISGLPMLERRADKRWGDEPDYQRYKEGTPVLVPRPPS